MLLLSVECARAARDDASTTNSLSVRDAAALEIGTATSAGRCLDDAVALVKVIDATHCEAPRSLFDGTQEGCLLLQPDVRRVDQDGRTVGFRNDSVHPRSVWALCGVRSGDIWTAFNGHALTAPEEVLVAYETVKHASVFTIALLRGAQPLTLTIVPTPRIP